MRRRIDVGLAVVLVALAAVGGLRYLDVTVQPVVVLQTAGPFVAIGLLLLLVLTLVLRRWWMAVPVVVALGVAASLAVPQFFSHTSPKVERDLTVMSANLLYGGADAQQLMDAVRYHGVDVLVLTEVTPEFVDRFVEVGGEKYFTSEAGEPRAKSFTGTIVYSRYPMTAVAGAGEQPVTGSTSLEPEVTVRVAGSEVRVKAAHPLAPLPGDTDEWRSGLRDLEAWKDRQTGSEPIVLAGDFNAGFGHPGFRSVADGMVDAQRAAGQGWVRTWPFVGRRIGPYVQLDHVLSRGLTLVDAGQVAIHGADHAVVWAAYAVPKG
ncbi:endonuclease/exonuclease/phosphatase [Intrasporangium oryzae NRRL B-24470]|uniref:Endonuclease/exonuclease/phosphatase n=1 Tax=Intrasporangium oryzae NRRL B-24470 TaxID=1386089 RepID=W9GBB9_9MICO|nr:endonuclease/exonuclease/phosphatase family protein [Intrasporangium oryzae]EWT03486.1 endonuclease/exonuclease/phosphatase [Intrasporangium oryzae NRRL B-24470]